MMWLPENVERDIAGGKAAVTDDGKFVRYFSIPGTPTQAPSSGGYYEISERHVDTPRGRAYNPAWIRP